jgi:hypothetical protein
VANAGKSLGEVTINHKLTSINAISFKSPISFFKIQGKMVPLEQAQFAAEDYGTLWFLLTTDNSII